MKWGAVTAIVLTASVGVAARARAQAPPLPRERVLVGRGSISGVVTRASSGEPLAGATVKLLNEPPSIAPPGAQVRMMTTGATTGTDGSFRFDGLADGMWWVVANLQGYLPAEYGQRHPTGTGTAISIVDGGRVSVRLAAWPTSGISGRVVDADGEPVGRAQVLALRVIYRDGKPATTIAQTVLTNDRGEYRMFWLTPGSYRVAARAWDPHTSAPAVNVAPPQRFATMEQATAPVVQRRTLPGGVLVEETDVPVYAPSTTDPQFASAITLASGDSASEVNIQMAGNRVAVHHVRGTSARVFTDVRAMLRLIPRVPAPFVTVPAAASRDDGTFDIPGVAPGSYLLYRLDGLAMLPVEVGDSDIDVVLPEQTLVQLTGRITIDRGLSAAAPPNLSEVQILMTRDPDVIGSPTDGGRFNRLPSENGMLNLNPLPLGDYRVAVLPFTRNEDDVLLSQVGRRPSPALRNAYVKSIRLGDADVLADGLHLWSPSQPPLDIVIAMNGAEVDGTALDDKSQPSVGMTVVAVPGSANLGRADLYRQTITDRQGHFTFTGLAPADYTFYAFDDIERGAWQNADFMRAFERHGRLVHLREGQNDTFELSAVSGR